MSSIQVKVALDKEAHPERYCPERRCLWRTDDPTAPSEPGEIGNYCPRHKPMSVREAVQAQLQRERNHT